MAYRPNNPMNEEADLFVAEIRTTNLGYVEAMGKGLIADGFAADHQWVVGLRNLYRAVRTCPRDQIEEMVEDVAQWAETIDCDGCRGAE